MTLLRESAVEKFGDAYFSAENNFGAPFAPKVIIQHNIYSSFIHIHDVVVSSNRFYYKVEDYKE